MRCYGLYGFGSAWCSPIVELRGVITTPASAALEQREPFEALTSNPISQRVLASGKLLVDPSQWERVCAFVFSFLYAWNQSLTFFSRKAFAMTETELRLIAAPAIIGLSSKPKNG